MKTISDDIFQELKENIDREGMNETIVNLRMVIDDLCDQINEVSRKAHAWQRRAEAAERDIETLLMEGCAGCDFCAKFGACSRNDVSDTYCDPEWRGPCEGNGGELE